MNNAKSNNFISNMYRKCDRDNLLLKVNVFVYERGRIDAQ